MDQTLQQIAGLARMGLNDAQIAHVLTMRPAPDATVQRAPAPPIVATKTERVKDRRGHRHIHNAVLDATRAGIVARGGSVDASLRKLVEWCPAEWLATQTDPKNPNVRGLGAVIADARAKNGGVIRGMRFTFLRVDPRPPHGSGSSSGNTVYRVEAV